MNFRRENVTVLPLLAALLAALLVAVAQSTGAERFPWLDDLDAARATAAAEGTARFIIGMAGAPTGRRCTWRR